MDTVNIETNRNKAIGPKGQHKISQDLCQMVVL